MGKNLLAFKQRQEFIRGDEVHFQEVVVFPKHPLDGVLLRLLRVLSCDQTKKLVRTFSEYYTSNRKYEFAKRNK